MSDILRVLTAAAVLALGLPPAAIAQTAKEHSSKETATAAQKVAVDPRTKEVRELTAEEAKALAEIAPLVSRPVESLTPTVLPSGALSIYLGDMFLDVALVQLGADGKLRTGCVHTVDDVRHFLQGRDVTSSSKSGAGAKPAPTTKLEEK